MSPAIWGLMTALGWGGADFIARFVGRALGHQVALFGMLTVGSVLLPLVVWQAGLELVWEPSGWWLLLLPVSMALVHYFAIRHEEAYLEAKFGAAYRDYRQRVRRWI